MHRTFFWLAVYVAFARLASGDEAAPNPPNRFDPFSSKAVANPVGAPTTQAPDFSSPRNFQSPTIDPQPVRSAAAEEPAKPRQPLATSDLAQAPSRLGDVRLAGHFVPAGAPAVEADHRQASSATTAPQPLPISARDAAEPINRAGKKTDRAEPEEPSPRIDSLMTFVGSLSVVVGLFLVTIWCLRRNMPKSTRLLPAEVVEVLGRAPLAGRQQMHLIRFGHKLVLAAISPAGVDTISEVTDPAEVDRLAGYCEQTRSASATAAFRGILDRLEESRPPQPPQPAQPATRAHRGLDSIAGLKGMRAEDAYV
jgi:flagellar biogenesis protein FliO